MLVAYRWLQEYTEVPWGPEELAERLTMLGLEVSSVRRPFPPIPNVVVGRITAVEPHPGSERLRVCTVDVGSRSIRAVTGAPNVRTGMTVPVALPGARLGQNGTEIRVAEIAGVASEGMLCSERELGIGDDASGIMALPDDVPVGEGVVEALGLDDAVLEIKVYPNRPDCQSVVGIAREVAALTRGTVRLPDAAHARGSKERPFEVRVEAPDLCSRFCAQVVEGVKIAPSPAWLQRYLRLCGMRPINNVVDVTNFVMLELGQPLHAYDLKRLAGPLLVARRAKPGEVVRTLDGVDRTLTEEMLVIADAAKAVGIAGVMGGEATEVTADTADIVLEAANFHAASVRRTSRTLGLQTEASLRFEKGLDPHLPAQAIARAASLIAELAHGKPSASVTDVHGELPAERLITVRPERVNRVLGTQISAADMKWMLRALHFSVEVTDTDRLQVRVPTYRSDVTREIDLIEEIARLYGYDNIAPTLPKGAGSRGGQSTAMEQLDALRRRLVSAGLSEAITYSFMSPQSLRHLGLPDDAPESRAIPILNPISEEMSTLRTTLIPNMLELLSRNLRRQVQSVYVFEIGAVFRTERLPLQAQPDERPTLAIGLTGEAPSRGWGDPARPVDFFDLKGLVEAALDVLGVEGKVAPFQHPAFHPGRCAAVFVGGERVGVLGEVHPEVLARFEIEQRAYVAELDLRPLLGRVRTPVFKPIPRYPALRRDLALLAPEHVPAEQIARILLEEGAPLLTKLELFDVYVGAQVPAGYRSLAYALEWQAPDRTLTEQEIGAVQERILNKLQELGVVPRG